MYILGDIADIVQSITYGDLMFFGYNCRIAKDPRFEQLPCSHKGTYADDCIVERVTQVWP